MLSSADTMSPGDSNNVMAMQLLADNAEDTAAFLKLLANQYRLMILSALIGKELSVGQLNDKVPLSQSALSQHLATLRNADVVATRREAQTIYYSLRDPRVIKVVEVLKDIFTVHNNGSSPSH